MNRALMVGVVVAAVVAVAGLTHVILFPDEGRPDLTVDESGDTPAVATDAPAASDAPDPSGGETDVAVVPEVAPSAAATSEPTESADTPAAEPSEDGAQRQEAAVSPDTTESEASATGTQPESPATESDDSSLADPPEFDIVRVGEDGITVVAGRAQPGATVSVFDGDKLLGSAVADARGEWVVVPTETMKPGDHRIHATAAMSDGPAVPSRDEVVLVVPEPSKDIAGAPTEEASESLALLVPRDGTGATTVLQAPEAPAAADEASGDAEADAPAGPAATAKSDNQAADTPSEQPTGQAGDEALSLDVVDYDEQGRVVLSGKVESGATVKGVLGGETIGTTAGADAGEWTLSPESPVAPGRYTLVLQQLDPGGNVVDQISVPFERAEVPEIPLDTNVVVQPGNSLWRIARRTYGDGVRFTVIYNANKERIRNPDLIYPGQILDLPEPPATN